MSTSKTASTLKEINGVYASLLFLQVAFNDEFVSGSLAILKNCVCQNWIPTGELCTIYSIPHPLNTNFILLGINLFSPKNFEKGELFLFKKYFSMQLAERHRLSRMMNCSNLIFIHPTKTESN
jgi:hypothetical protein